MTRHLCVAAVAALGMIAAGCGSHNSGKIVGRWKADALDVGPVGPKGLADFVWDFREDGSYTITRYPIEPGSPKGEELVTGHYILAAGDRIEFSQHTPVPKDGKTRAFATVKIDGDTMMMGGGKDVPARLTRLPPQ